MYAEKQLTGFKLWQVLNCVYVEGSGDSGLGQKEGLLAVDSRLYIIQAGRQQQCHSETPGPRPLPGRDVSHFYYHRRVLSR